MDQRYDVAIIGGGPAGSTAATLLAKKRRRVVVLEREKFPRFHIGESLLPASMPTLERLGVREKLDAGGYMEKFGAEIATACETSSRKIYFKDGYRARESKAYQVLRSEFDEMLLDHAAAAGAEVHQETTVEQIQFGTDEVTLSVRGKASASPVEVRARYVIDASGRNTLVGAALKLKESYAHLQKFSVYAHFDGVQRDEGIDGTLTRMLRSADRWFWLIPLSPIRTSVGVVMDSAEVKRLRLAPEQLLDQALAGQPVMQARMAGARRVTPVHSSGDYSYRNKRFAGDRWLLAGDAAGFIDPVFSTGVFIALLSGEKAADALDQVLDRPTTRGLLFSRYERNLHRVMDLYLRFVNAWYSQEFVEVFVTEFTRFQLAGAINSVLAGDSARSFGLRWRVRLFYIFLAIQRRFPICPRLTLLPRTAS